MISRSQMSLIFVSNWIKMTAFICPSIRKMAALNFVYSLAPTNIKQSAPNLVKMYMTIRSQVNSFMGQIGRN